MSDEIILAVVGAISAGFTLAINLQSRHIHRMQDQINLLIETCLGDTKSQKN